GKEEGHPDHQAAAAGRQGHAGASRRHCPRPDRGVHPGLREAVQRRHRGPGRQHRPRRGHDLRGPVLQLRAEDHARAGADPGRSRDRQGRLAPEERGGGHHHRRPGHRDRQGEAARPQHPGPRGGQGPGPRHRTLHGRGGQV
ncbi:MAG: LSU ribosomal protein L11p (L12e), partial [uncultured Acidimicrobiales bacterium]